MTTAIEVTERKMYHAIAGMKGRIEINYSVKDMLSGVDNVEHALEAHLEALRQDRAALVTERDTLRNRVQVLEMANATSGEVIRSLKQEVTSLKREASQARKNLMAARLAEVAASVSVPPYNASGDALDGNTDDILELRSRAIAEMVERHEARKAKAAEQKHVQEERVAAMNAEVMKVSMGMNRMLWSLWADAFPKETCMHSFHPAFPSGELCTFCGVGK